MHAQYKFPHDCTTFYVEGESIKPPCPIYDPSLPRSDTYHGNECDRCGGGPFHRSASLFFIANITDWFSKVNISTRFLVLHMNILSPDLTR